MLLLEEIIDGFLVFGGIMNPVKKSIDDAFIDPKHVAINEEKATDLAKRIAASRIYHWSEDCPIDLCNLNQEELVAFKFVFNAISFSYWGKPKWQPLTNFERGTWNLIYALNSAVKEGLPILSPNFLANLEEQGLQYILHGNSQIPLFKERLRILREIGNVIKNKYNGKFSAIIEEGNFDTLKIVDKIITDFPSFNDSSVYKGKKVQFNKRAQLLVSDLAYEDERIARVEQLTACADYILPMVLAYKGVIELSGPAHRKNRKTYLTLSFIAVQLAIEDSYV